MADLAGLWGRLGKAQQIALVAFAVLVPLGVFGVSQWMGDGQYVPLFSSLGSEDAGAVVAQLKAAKVPYRIAGAGDQILVPADKVSEARLRVATQGLPLGGGVGFEVFDRSSLGLSDFTQRLNYQRALQGELARTIGQLRGVARARVHLVLPQPSLFTERERPATASVFLKLAPGVQLSREEVRGIVHLVSGSVEALSPDRVTVIDTAGRVLSVAGEAGVAGLSPRRMEIKAAVEEGLERRVQSLLDTTLGPGQAVARVSAQLELDQVERTEERFDPNVVMRQKTRTVENTKSRASTPVSLPAPPPPSDLAAPANPATPNLAAAPPAPPTSSTANDGTRESETMTYEVSKVVARTLTTPGEIRRISVAVILNAATRVSQKADQKTDQKEIREPAPRAPEELEKLRKVVMSAVGYSDKRGDEVTLVEMPFDTSLADRERALLEQAPAPPPARPALDVKLLGAAGAGVLLLAGLAAWLLVRRRRQRVDGLNEVARALSLDETVGAAAGGGSEAEIRSAMNRTPRASPLMSEEALQATRDRDDIRQKAVAMASTEPDATAQLLRAWLVKKKSLQPTRG